MVADCVSPLVLITGGGTGGHVFPGLAAAEVLTRRGARVQWLGTSRGYEARLVPAAGIELFTLRVSGLRGKTRWQQLLAPFMLISALLQAMVLMWRLKPDCVLGTGGFVAGPGGLAAWLLRKPLLIHEQNSIPGTTNRLLSKIADKVLCGFPTSFANHPRAQFVGNPVREEIQQVAEPQKRLENREGELRVLVLGGSQGSRAINRAVCDTLSQLAPTARPTLWHQCGQLDEQRCRQQYQDAGIEVRLDVFINDVAGSLSWADLVICRAGALTVAEIACAGVAALFVPLPNAIDDHQRHNARWLAENNAAMLREEAELTPAFLIDLFEQCQQNRGVLLQTASSAREMGMPAASETVANLCLEVCDGR